MQKESRCRGLQSSRSVQSAAQERVGAPLRNGHPPLGQTVWLRWGYGQHLADSDKVGELGVVVRCCQQNRGQWRDRIGLPEVGTTGAGLGVEQPLRGSEGFCGRVDFHHGGVSPFVYGANCEDADPAPGPGPEGNDESMSVVMANTPPITCPTIQTRTAIATRSPLSHGPRRGFTSHRPWA